MDFLVQEIENKLGGFPRPPDDDLAGCHCEDCIWEVADFRGKSWQSLSINDLLYGQQANIKRLDDAGFLYFLPAFLRIALEPDNSLWATELLEQFTYSDLFGHERDKIQRRINCFNTEQKIVIKKFFVELYKTNDHVPAIIKSACANVTENSVSCYSQDDASEWVAAKIENQLHKD